MGPPETRRRRPGTAVKYGAFFLFKLVSKHPGPVHIRKGGNNEKIESVGCRKVRQVTLIELDALVSSPANFNRV